MEKAIAAERENLRTALFQQNAVWDLCFKNYAAKPENIKKNDGLASP